MVSWQVHQRRIEKDRACQRSSKAASFTEQDLWKTMSRKEKKFLAVKSKIIGLFKNNSRVADEVKVALLVVNK